MVADRCTLGANAQPLLLNLGCGTYRRPEYVNVDAFAVCKPDVVWDLNETPYPWPDNSVDGIMMTHVLEHLENWWGAFTECARILKPGGTLVIVDFERIEGVSRQRILEHVRAGKETVIREVEAEGFRLLGERKLMQDNYFVSFEKPR